MSVWRPEPELMQSLDRAIPGILASQRENGQFGSEPWISTDQNQLLALAAAWSLEESCHYHSDEVLDAVARGGYALVDAQDEEGKWTFRKKDYSEWGQILMPWVYSRWIRAYRLVREAMSDEARDRWESGLLLGFERISTEELTRVHNIPAHHAMGLYCAGLVFEREEWRTQATAFIREVAAAQSPHGWWPEHGGPVVSYNFVYSEALGVYHALSRDHSVLEALERSARYHANFTYPDGSAVETVDGRNPYHEGVRLGNPGLSYSAAGRGYLAQQHSLHLAPDESRPDDAGPQPGSAAFDADYAAALLLYAGEGDLEEPAAGRERHLYQMGDEALVVRHKPWFSCLSAFTGEVPDNRWGQDRQSFVSVYHDSVGLIAGGGSTKLQPLWSTFTVGDTSLLKHRPGDENPDFRPRQGLIHVPERAELDADPEAARVRLHYGAETGSVTVRPMSQEELVLVMEATASSGVRMEGHVTLVPHLGEEVRWASGESAVLGEEPIAWRAGNDGGWLERAGWRVSVPSGVSLTWPALPHNPYRKGGEAEVDEARLVLTLPFSPDQRRYEMSVVVG